MQGEPQKKQHFMPFYNSGKGTGQTQIQSTGKKSMIKEENELPPIGIFEKPKSCIQQEYFAFNFSQGMTLCRMKNVDEISFTPRQKQQEKVNDSTDEMVSEKNETQKVERSYSENCVESDDEIHHGRQNIQMTTKQQKEQGSNQNQLQGKESLQPSSQQVQTQTIQNPVVNTVVTSVIRKGQTNTHAQLTNKHQQVQTIQQANQNVNKQVTNVNSKKPKLRIQTNADKSKYRPILKINPKVPVDPNLLKRKEMMKYLKQTQMQLFHPMVKIISQQQTNETRIKTFIKDITDYCSKNDFFNCEIHETNEVIVFANMFSEQRFGVIFNLNEPTYENWNFPKPRSMDGHEICDKFMLDRMKKQPSIETFMHELFRIASQYISEYVYM